MIFLTVFAVVIACWHSIVALHYLWTDWGDRGNTHGYLIAGICLWLLWRDRSAYAAAAMPFSLSRAWPLTAIMLCWLLSVMVGLQSAELLLLPIVFWCAVVAAMGWLAARRASFPIFYLLFAVPAWGFANGLFQWSSVYAVRVALRIVGIPAYFDVNRVQIPEGTFEIEGGCSGLHFVVVALALAALLGELGRDRLAHRIKLLLLALGLAMFTNWVRIFIIILAGHLTDMQSYLVARSHYAFGWMLFGVAMAVFFWIESRVAPPALTSPATPLPAAARDWRGVIWGVIPVLALFALWHLLAVRPAAGNLDMPTARADWRIQEATTETWHPVVIGVDESRQLLYRRNDGATVDVYAGLYRWQMQDKEFSAYANDLFPDANTVASDRATIAGSPFNVLMFRDAAGQEHLVAASYRVGQRAFAQPDRAQLWYALRALSQLRSPMSHVLLLETSCRPDCAVALNVLREWKDQS